MVPCVLLFSCFGAVCKRSDFGAPDCLFSPFMGTCSAQVGSLCSSWFRVSGLVLEPTFFGTPSKHPRMFVWTEIRLKNHLPNEDEIMYVCWNSNLSVDGALPFMVVAVLRFWGDLQVVWFRSPRLFVETTHGNVLAQAGNMWSSLCLVIGLILELGGQTHRFTRDLHNRVLLFGVATRLSFGDFK